MRNGSKLKRPGLYAVKALLEEVKENDSIEIFTYFEAVKNRRDRRRYLDLLLALDWIKLCPLSGIVRMRSYEITEKGKAFLELFPEGK